MKKLLILITLLLTLSCNEKCEIISEPENPELVKYLDAAIKAAYDIHLWMQEDSSCMEYNCCWEYVPMTLRYKYENDKYLTVEDKEAIIEGLELSPSFIDTLDELDEFYNLYCYKTYGKEYFETWFDIE